MIAACLSEGRSIPWTREVLNYGETFNEASQDAQFRKLCTFRLAVRRIKRVRARWCTRGGRNNVVYILIRGNSTKLAMKLNNWNIDVRSDEIVLSCKMQLVVAPKFRWDTLQGLDFTKFLQFPFLPLPRQHSIAGLFECLSFHFDRSLHGDKWILVFGLLNDVGVPWMLV